MILAKWWKNMLEDKTLLFGSALVVCLSVGLLLFRLGTLYRSLFTRYLVYLRPRHREKELLLT